MIHQRDAGQQREPEPKASAVAKGSLRIPDLALQLPSRDPDCFFWPSCRADQLSAWHGHVSFAHWLVQAAQPTIIVELGTHNGVSFAAFCNAVRRLDLSTRCFAVDTWQGDIHSGHYGEGVYLNLQAFVQTNFAPFAVLIRSLFDEALGQFHDGSVDILHIDGLHTYEAVRHDYETWLPKLSDRGIILFHDTCVRSRDFGVWRLWEEICLCHPHFNFTHSAGLGVLAVGSVAPQPITSLCAIDESDATKVRDKFTLHSEHARRNGKELIKEHNDSIRKRLDQFVSQLGKNIALHCTAAQSSEFSGPPTPQGAVNGIKTGLFGFHTKFEKDPWWTLDFGEVKAFDIILVYNRLDGPCPERSRTLRVLVSDDDATWTVLYAHDGSLFGGIDGAPLHIMRPGSRARFVKLQLQDWNYLHLDEVEIYATKAI